MNERIRELAEQVYGTQATEQEIKFAELIVRKCAKVSEDDITDGDACCTNTAYRIASQIKEHFGVEVECNQEEQEKFAPKHKCTVCGTTENVRWMGGYQPYLCDSVDCIPF
jgi:hypothetical protein